MSTQLDIGALGPWRLPQGLYVYVGSAWGSGGLRARVQRHLRGSSNPRWHVDYLRAVTTPVAVWLAPHNREECSWAQYLLALPQAEVIVPRFGASDCKCESHLVYMGNMQPAEIVFPRGIKVSLLTANEYKKT